MHRGVVSCRPPAHTSAICAGRTQMRLTVRPRCDDPAMRTMLVLWWLSCMGVTWWTVGGQLPPLTAVIVAAATLFMSLLWRGRPASRRARLAVYLSGLTANQADAATSGFWPLLPGHHLHKVPETAAGLGKDAVAAALAIATFALVRAWVSARGRNRYVPRRQLPWSTVLGAGSTAALLYVVVMDGADELWSHGAHLLSVTHTSYPYAHGGFGEWLLAMASGSLAGAIEEPVYVGLLVLLWPRCRLRTVLPLALLSGVARSIMHLYYAADTGATLATSVALVVMWCVVWSSASLLLTYWTRLLWPVVVAHGLKDVMATWHGPFDPGTGLTVQAALLVPLAVLLGIAGLALNYSVPRLVDLITKRVVQWRNKAQPIVNT